MTKYDGTIVEINTIYNTIKMYENTLREMEERGASKLCKELVSSEKLAQEKLLMELIGGNVIPEKKLDNVAPHGANAMEDKASSEDETPSISQFNHYKANTNFFDAIEKIQNEVKGADNHSVEEKVVCEGNDIEKFKKRNSLLSENVDNILMKRNFIVRFSDKLNIPSYLVSSCFAVYGGEYDHKNNKFIKGSLKVTLRDYAYEIGEEQMVCLTKLMFDIGKHEELKKVGDIFIDVLTNRGDVLYTICYKDCTFSSATDNGFTYETSDIREWRVWFTFSDVDAYRVVNTKLNETTE